MNLEMAPLALWPAQGTQKKIGIETFLGHPPDLAPGGWIPGMHFFYCAPAPGKHRPPAPIEPVGQTAEQIKHF